MSIHLRQHSGSNGVFYVSDRANGVEIKQTEGFEEMSNGKKGNCNLVEWLNEMLPHLNLPPEASEEELRACLIDGTVLCSILDKLSPVSIPMGDNFEPGIANIERFLTAMDEMALPRFELSDLEQGNMVPVLQCLKALKASFSSNGGVDRGQIHQRKRWNPLEADVTGESDCSQGNMLSCIEPFISDPSAALKLGSYADLSDAKISELIKSCSMQKASAQSLFNLLNKILEESIERKNGDVSHHVAYLLRGVLQLVERKISTQAENLKIQNNLFRAREEKYQSIIRLMETLATGTTEENEVVMNQLVQIKLEKIKLEEKEKLEEQDVLRLKKEKDASDMEILRLKKELELGKKMHEQHCLKLEVEAKETRAELEKKLKEAECLLIESRKKVEELESFTETKSLRWKKKERMYRSFMDCQFGVLQELRITSESIKRDVLKTRRNYLQEFNSLGVRLKGLTDAAQNYHSVLVENRKLYNEIQDLKGNIRVYCRIRPFLQGQNKKQTTIEYIGENGELVVVNPSRQGKDTHRLFKFNKVFGPTATQEEVFLDTQPLIRSVLDGYNVCIFAYGQTGSGKTYTMSGPTASSKEDWGVNYRALNDLFQISQSRKNSIIYEIGVQMVEIYNEQVRDLLSNSSPQKRLGIWNTVQPNGLAVPDASMHSVKSTEDVLELMSIGLMNRAVGATALNERSSRSHSVLTVHVRGTDMETDAVLRGSLHLVDLAGSERVDRSEATGDRLKEAQHINKSLSALGDVIFALAQKSSHVPYRNSKLTQVLQSSLGGQAKTLMFVQLSPDVDSYSETVSTLKFAERVSGVELGAARSNKEGRDVRELMEQVASLKDAIANKDEEIERLQQLKASLNSTKHGMGSLRYESSSPRRHSVGASPRSRSLPRGKSSRATSKASSDAERLSENSDKHSEGGSHQSLDESRYHKELLPQSKLAGSSAAQNLTEDIELLGLRDADSEERLSDISDGDLSMGTETDGSIGSLVEFTLFPETAKPADKAESIEEVTVPSKLPRPTQKSSQKKPSRLSITTGSSSKLLASARKATTPSISSATKASKRWQ